MATVKLSIYVSDIATVIASYDRIMVYRCATKTGTYTEITSAPTRIVLVSGTSLYSYTDTTAPSTSYWYKTSYYHSGTALQSSLSAPFQAIDGGLYCSVQDIRDEGISVSELSDVRAILLIKHWQQWFDSATRNFFTVKEATVDIDGNGTSYLHLPVPIISCTSLYINDDMANAVDTSEYRVYNQRGPVVDDRHNPKIRLTSGSTSSVYTTGSSGIFQKGLLQRIVGSWGYVEPDDTTPIPVQRAVKILVVATYQTIAEGEVDQMVIGRKVEEVTDRHRIKFADLYDSLSAWNPSGLTEVDMAIRMYRSPIRVDVAGSSDFSFGDV